MHRLELSVILNLSLEIHLPEHVQGGLLALLPRAGTALGLNRPGKLPASLTTLETEGLAVITGRNDLVFRLPK